MTSVNRLDSNNHLPDTRLEFPINRHNLLSCKELKKSKNGLKVYHIETSLCSCTWKCHQTDSTCREVPPNMCNIKCNAVHKIIILKTGQEEGRTGQIYVHMYRL